jgi:hypothetical protein
MVAVVLVSAAVLAPALASQQRPAPPQAAVARTGADPTDFITRIEPSYEHKRLENGTQLDQLTLRGDLALRRNLSLRLDVPLVGYRATSAAAAAGLNDAFGLGDVVTQLMVKPYSSAHMATLLGMRADLNTATAPGMGQGGTTYAPVAAVGFFPNPKWVVAPVAQWYLGNDFDNAPLPGTHDRDELSLRLVTIYQAGKPNLAYLLVDPEYVHDFESDLDRLTVSAEYGTMVGRTALILLRPSIGLKGEGGAVDWGLKFAFRQMWPGNYIIK